MANLSKDIQCAGSDTRPPMLDRTDFASWQQHKDRYNADIQATNILLQGLPKDIYSLINHYTDAKDIWDNVKMLLEGSELTKEDRESQLYDDFEHFRQHKGETIHEYYVWFAKLINDMRNIKMTMSRMQLNSKYVNNMLPEWGRFVTAVKLNRGLRDSNYDQLYAYLKQHEAHANENKMMLDRFTQHIVDPLALMSNVASQQYNSQSSTNPLSTHNVQGRQNRGQGNNARGAGTAGYGGALSRVGNANTAKQGSVSATTTMENLWHWMKNSYYFLQLVQADDCDAFDSNVDEARMAQIMFMANLSSADPVYDEASPSYDSDILSEYVKDNVVPVVQSNVSSVTNDAYMMIYNDMCVPHSQSASKTTRNIVVDNSLTAELETYKEQVELYERRARPYKNELNKVAISYKNPSCLTRAKHVQPALYNGYEIVKNNHVPVIVHNTEDTLEIAEITRRKMHDKMKDPKCVTHKVKIAPPHYSKENYLATFTPQKQLTPEQIFWSQDIINMKEEALKEQTTASRPTKALTVYLPNTPATLVPNGSINKSKSRAVCIPRMMEEEATANAALIMRKWKGSLEIKDTPITITPRSPKTITDSLYLHKEKLRELTVPNPHILKCVEMASGSTATCDAVMITDSKEAFGRFDELTTSGFAATPGQFVARLAEHFGLLTAEILGGLMVIAPELPIIEMGELVRLQICIKVDDTWVWVVIGPERQPDAAANTPEVAQDTPIVDEGGQADPAPVQALPSPPAPARTMPQRMARLEEDVHRMGRA
ncbi:hypothetical protein Tco_0565962 [Tanacetum coccineum]